MSDQSYTAAQAADPQTPAQVLADIAAVRPDLRPAVARNPSAYPSLLEWLGSLGEPSVDAALRERTTAAPRETGPTAPVGPGGYSSAPGGSPYGGQPGHGQHAAPGYGAQPTTPGYGAQPTTPGYGAQPTGATAYGTQPGSAPGYGSASGAAGPMAGASLPPQGYAGYQPAPARSGSKKALWIVLGIVGFVIVLVVVAVVVIGNLVNNAVTDLDVGYGSDPAMDALWDRCEDEDWAACDQLYEESPIGSEYEHFGDTCGNRMDAGTQVYCTDRFGG